MKKTSRRTMLFCPANKPKNYYSAPLFEPDCILFDLEDAIPVSEKAETRILLCEAFKTLDFENVEPFVRINGRFTPFGEDDIRAIVPAGVRLFRLAMTETPEDILWASNILDEIEDDLKIPRNSVLIQASIETPLAVSNVFDIAKSSKRITSISFGAEDFTRSLGVDRTKTAEELTWARSQVVAAASIIGVEAIDTVWSDFKDMEGFEKEVKNALQIGFSGKSCIHPSQIEVVHRLATPNKEEVEKSIIILKAAKEANIEDGGVIQVNGKMVDIPVIKKAERIIAKAISAKMITKEDI